MIGTHHRRTCLAAMLLGALALAPPTSARDGRATAESEGAPHQAPAEPGTGALPAPPDVVEAADSDPLAAARAARRQGRHAEAVELLRARLDVAGADREARRLLVDTLLALDDVDAAAKAAEEARRTAPNDARTFVSLADVLARRGQLDAAERFYAEARRRDPELAAALVGLGRMLESRGDRASAVAAFREAYRLQPDDPGVSLPLAASTPDAAERLALLRAVERNLEDPVLRLRLAAALPLLEALAGRETCRLVSDVEHASLPMRELDFHQRSLSGALAGGREVPFLLDTGASGLLLDEKLARKAGIESLTAAELGGIGDWGSLRGAVAVAPEVTFGPVRFADCPVQIADTRFRIGERGVVGADLFEDFVLHFDFENHRLELERLPVLRDGEGARVLADRHIGPQHAGWTPIRVWRGDVLVDTRVNGDRSAWFLLDTGAQFNLLDAGLAAEIVQLKRYTQLGLRGFSGEVQEVYQAQQRVDLAFAGLQQGNDGILAMDLSGLSSSMGVEIGGVLGYEVLRHLDLAIDYRNALVRLRPR